MSSGPKIKWDESRSPQWKWLLRKKDSKYYKRREEKRKNAQENAKNRAEIAEMTDCSVKKDKISADINAELTEKLKKVRKEVQ